MELIDSSPAVREDFSVDVHEEEPGKLWCYAVADPPSFKIQVFTDAQEASHSYATVLIYRAAWAIRSAIDAGRLDEIAHLDVYGYENEIRTARTRYRYS